MDITWFQIIFGSATIYFGSLTIRILPTLLRLLGALITGTVKWPGPRIHDLDRNASILRSRLGVGYQNLFPAFLENSGSVIAGFFFSLFSFLSSTSLLSGYIAINSPWCMLILSAVALAGARMAYGKAKNNAILVNTLLSGLKMKEEPRAVDGRSAESQYAIEHPLIGRGTLKAESRRALDQYYESVRCHQDGDEQRALILYQEAMNLDPSLHKHAYDSLSALEQRCSKNEAGSIYYWLGIHAEHLDDRGKAAEWYEKAILEFKQLGYRNRESRVHCNLGKLKMMMHDPSAMEEYEKATALNPKDGIAHLNIARIYYSISSEGSEQFDRALEAFADAMMADPITYGPMVVSSLRAIGYTWKEDLEKITKKVERKQRENALKQKGILRNENLSG